MTELSFAHRKDQQLVLVDQAGNEFTLPVDSTLLSEVQICLQRAQATGKVNPARIQKLLRQGLNVTEVAQQTGYTEYDVARFAPPVTAEMEYILERAHAVPVRTDANAHADEKFGEVIAARLVTLAAENITWRSWRDETLGWQVQVKFISYDTEHSAVWSFDNQKQLLTALTADAVELSKQSEPSEKLIPKVRQLNFSQAAAAGEHPAAGHLPPLPEFTETTTTAEPVADLYDYAAALNHKPAATPEQGTAQLLDSLRKRRKELELQNTTALPDADSPAAATQDYSDAGAENTANSDFTTSGEPEYDEEEWEPADFNNTAVMPQLPTADAAQVSEQNTAAAPQQTDSTAKSGKPKTAKKKARAQIPSWDDILFGNKHDAD